MKIRFLLTAFLVAVGLAAATANSGLAAIATTLDEPDTTLASNTVIDIITHNGGIWMATGEGINFSMDGGDNWLLYTDENGLNSGDISALFSAAGLLWVAGAYSEVVSGQNIVFSDTLLYTENDGRNFYGIDLSENNRSVPFAFGAQKTIFDIAGGHAQDNDWVFFSAFAGGFMGSRDNGATWRRMHPSVSDSIEFDRFYTDPEYTGDLSTRLRFFSCAADTMHGDSMFVWAGTAGGVFQYIFAPKSEKPNSPYLSSIIFCPECGSGDSSRVFLGGENGITRSTTTGSPYHSAFVEDGLPGPFISAQMAVDGRLFVGTKESRDGASTGLAVSDDGGLTFSEVASFAPYIGADRTISSMTMMGDRFYVAAQEAGLFVSPDTGASWTHLWVDSSDTTPANGRNVVWGLDALADTLRIGTDSGLVTFHMDPTGVIDSTRYDVFREQLGESGSRVIKVKTQLFYDTLGAFDSLAVWTINRAVTDTGSNCVKRMFEVEFFGDTIWDANNYQWQVATNDIAFMGDTVFAVGEAGLRWNDQGANPSTIYLVRDSASVDRLDNDTITVMEISGDTVFIGTNRGFAISIDRGLNYKIFRINTDPLVPDVVINHGILSSLLEIPGSWIPAMGLQSLPGEPYDRVWVSSRPTQAGERTGIAVGTYKPTDSTGERYDLKWQTMLDSIFAWNFAFDGNRVFAATDQGLLYTDDDTLPDWDTIFLREWRRRHAGGPGDADLRRRGNRRQALGWYRAGDRARGSDDVYRRQESILCRHGYSCR